MTREQNAIAAIVKDQVAHIEAAKLLGATVGEARAAEMIVQRMATKLAAHLEQNNKSFDRKAFMLACGVGA